MNIAATIELHGGGPGSGCNPSKGKCGRPPGKGKRGTKAGKPRGGKFGDMPVTKITKWAIKNGNRFMGFLKEDAAWDLESARDFSKSLLRVSKRPIREFNIQLVDKPDADERLVEITYLSNMTRNPANFLAFLKKNKVNVFEFVRYFRVQTLGEEGGGWST